MPAARGGTRAELPIWGVDGRLGSGHSGRVLSLDWLDEVACDLESDEGRAMRVATSWVDLAREHLPPLGLRALSVATSRWVDGRLVDLEPIRVECWQYLDAKNGNSTTIASDEDRAMRALIGCLYNAVNLDLYEHVAFIAEMLVGTGVEPAKLVQLASSTA
jgi:hypothetical protein